MSNPSQNTPEYLVAKLREIQAPPYCQIAADLIERLTRERDRWEILVSSKTTNAVLLELGKMGKVIDERDEAIRTANENRKSAEAEIRNLGAENARLREALHQLVRAVGSSEDCSDVVYERAAEGKKLLKYLTTREGTDAGPNRQRG
jgi:hypothetical protein